MGDDLSPAAAEWELWRQDDNGNRFRGARFGTRRAADAEQQAFEARGHKQTYWVQPRPAADPR
jgi:8-oxo-dGTP diphosphatase